MHYKRIYIIFFSIIIILVVVSQMLTYTHLKNQESFTRIIDLAGQQRNNCLNINQACFQTQHKDLQYLLSNETEDLRQLIDHFEKIHWGLQSGDEALQLPGNNSNEIKQLFKEVAPYYSAISNGARQMLSGELAPVAQAATYRQIDRNTAPFIAMIDKITARYDEEAKAKIHQLQYYEFLLALLTLITIGLEVLLIINPILKHYYKKSYNLKQHNRELEKMNKQILQQNEQLNYYNEELSKAKEDAEIAMMEKAMFLSNMSHEIRTPMNAVLGITNLMLDEKPRADQIPSLKTLKFSAENLLTILNDILDFGKIESGNIKIESIPFYPKEIIENIRQSLAPQLKKKNLPLVISIDKSLPEGLIGDPVRLSQVLFNLLGNAIKFTEQGGIQLNIQLQKIDNDKASIYFEVKDSGIGIPGEKLDTIFERFTQANTDTTRLYGGTGLGLAICKRLIELQDGQIGVQSQEGQGSTFFFTITFPISFESQQPSIKEKDPSLKKEYLFNSLQKILIVEDNKINQMVISKFLKKWSVRFDIAENGKIAVEKVQQNNYSLVLMDLQMPEMDGYEATQLIRTMQDGKYSQLPIIALSASAMLEIRDKAFQVGVNEYVCKPFKPDELFFAMAKYMN